MAGNIDEFRARLSGGGARANQFRITINAPADIAIGLNSRDASFLCQATNLPAMSLGEFPLNFRGRQIYIAGDREFADAWTTTFFNDTSFSIRSSLERWSNGINDLELSTGVNDPAGYMADLEVFQLDRDDNVLKSYKFINAWPQSIGAVELSMETTNAIETFECTWRYQHFLSSDVSEASRSSSPSVL